MTGGPVVIGKLEWMSKLAYHLVNSIILLRFCEVQNFLFIVYTFTPYMAQFVMQWSPSKMAQVGVGYVFIQAT